METEGTKIIAAWMAAENEISMDILQHDEKKATSMQHFRDAGVQVQEEKIDVGHKAISIWKEDVIKSAYPTNGGSAATRAGPSLVWGAESVGFDEEDEGRLVTGLQKINKQR